MSTPEPIADTVNKAVTHAATDPFARIADYYGSLVQKFGHDPRACDYGRAESQQIKFRVLSEVMSLENSSVLDVGCGFADFAVFLNRKFSGVRYSGIDLCPAMIDEARRQHPGLDLQVANLAEASFDRGFDVITANGIFYLLGEQAWPMTKRLIQRMFALATKAVAFNSLSSWAGDLEPGEFYADPFATLKFCRTLTPRVTLRHDYHSRDFTIYLYKSRT